MNERTITGGSPSGSAERTAGVGIPAASEPIRQRHGSADLGGAIAAFEALDDDAPAVLEGDELGVMGEPPSKRRDAITRPGDLRKIAAARPSSPWPPRHRDHETERGVGRRERRDLVVDEPGRLRRLDDFDVANGRGLALA